MSTYYDGYHAAKSTTQLCVMDFVCSVCFIIFIVMCIRGLINLGEGVERQRIDELLKPTGITIEHLEKQAEIAKANKLAQPIPLITCQHGACISTVEKSK